MTKYSLNGWKDIPLPKVGEEYTYQDRILTVIFISHLSEEVYYIEQSNSDEVLALGWVQWKHCVVNGIINKKD